MCGIVLQRVSVNVVATCEDGCVCRGILEGVLQRVAACCSKIGGTKLLNRQEDIQMSCGSTLQHNTQRCNILQFIPTKYNLLQRASES